MSDVEVNITIFPLDPYRELTVYYLSEAGFHGFKDTEDGLQAYITDGLWNESDFVAQMKFLTGKAEWSYQAEVLQDINWNEAWEQNFQPVTVNDKLRIRATFHQPDPAYPMELIIEPRMSFGTGHHDTTAQMAAAMLETDFHQKSVLDMGSGTGILAILAKKLGAAQVTAIDYDEWCFKNAAENVRLNQCNDIEILHGDAGLLGNRKFHVILANINRNVLLADMHLYRKALLQNGVLMVSGFYLEDHTAIRELAESLKLTYVKHTDSNRWVMCTFKNN
jgi:ribosomal protein L11 methyltransferase